MTQIPLPLPIGEDEDDGSFDGLNTSLNSSKSNRRKSRIPWDRRDDSDRNGLKKDLLDAVLRHQTFSLNHGKLEDSFKAISQELSVPGGKFYPFGGIIFYAAQKKVLSLLKDVASLLNISDETDLDSINADMNSFIGVAVELLKAKQQLGEKKLKRVLPPKVETFEHNLIREYNIDKIYHDSKRRRLSEHNDANDSELSTKTDPNEPDHFIANISNSSDRRSYVSNELIKKGITTIGDLLNHANISEQGIETFTKVTGFKTSKPVHILLALLEEVLSSKNCYRTCKRDLGLIPSDSYELIETVKGLYLEFEHLPKV